MIDFAYLALQHLRWLQELSANIHKFDNTLLHMVDLTRAASSAKGTVLASYGVSVWVRGGSVLSEQATGS